MVAMAMRATVHSGSLSGGLSLCGTGLAMALPAQNWIGWLIVAFGVLVLFLDIHIEQGHVEVGGLNKPLRKGKVIVAGSIIACCCAAIVLTTYYWPLNFTSHHNDESQNAAPAHENIWPPTAPSDLKPKANAIDEVLKILDGEFYAIAGKKSDELFRQYGKYYSIYQGHGTPPTHLEYRDRLKLYIANVQDIFGRIETIREKSKIYRNIYFSLRTQS